MANLFNRDFQEFIQSLTVNDVSYVLVSGYAVILHGYIRSTADMDVWVKKTKQNYQKLAKALLQFGAPVFSEDEFLGNRFNVWGFGKEPNKIEIMSEVKGLKFAKNAAGRYKDKNDIEQLKKKI